MVKITTFRGRLMLSAVVCGLAAIDAASAMAQDAVTEEIIVTARKRAENIQDVPVSIAVVSASMLANKGITQTNALVSAVPNLQIGSAYSTVQPNFTLRGVGTANQYTPNTASPVGIYVDEAYEAFRPGQGQQLFDLERIEVVRGPQGTLFGRNTTGGAINFITKNPTLDGEADGYLFAGYGNYNAYNVEAASNVTLVKDKLAFRVAAIYRERDGYIKNIGQGPDFASLKTRGVRFSVLARPTDDLDVTLKAYIVEDRPIPVVGIAPGVGPGQTNFFGYSRANLANDEAGADYIGRLKLSTKGVTLTPVWKLGDFTVTSVTNYEISHYSDKTDCDATPLDACSQPHYGIGYQASEDFRVAYSHGRFNAIVGGYYGWDKQSYAIGTGFFGLLTAPGAFNPAIDGIFDPLQPPTGIYYRNTYTQKRESYAFYGEMSYDVTPKLSLTLGARGTRDRNVLEDYQTALLDSIDGTPRASTVPFSTSYDPGNVLPRLSNSNGVFSWRALGRYKFTDDIMAFVSYSRGSRAGNYNGFALVPAEVVYVSPERADAYELGTKAQFFDRKLTLNASVFYIEYGNQQVQDQVVGPGGVLVTTLNGLNGHVLGFEAEAQYAVNQDLKFGANIGALKTRYSDGQILNGQPVGGNAFPYAPKLTVQLNGEWTMWRDGDQSLTLFGEGNYTGRFHYDPTNEASITDPRFNRGSDPYWLANARLTYKIDRYSLSVWVRNLTDKYYTPFFVQQESGFGQNYSVRGEPRMFGAEVRVTF